MLFTYITEAIALVRGFTEASRDDYMHYNISRLSRFTLSKNF